MKEKIKNIFYLFFPIFMGFIIGLITKDSISYNDMIKPPFSPSPIVFPIAWSILYLLIGISYYLLKKEKDTKLESIIYYLQLFFNFTWPIIYFVFNFQILSVIWIIILLFLTIFMTYLFYQKNKLSAYLLIPYILWLIFATYLNIGTTILN